MIMNMTSCSNFLYSLLQAGAQCTLGPNISLKTAQKKQIQFYQQEETSTSSSGEAVLQRNSNLLFSSFNFIIFIIVKLCS